MIVECSYCEARIDARVVATHTDPPDEDVGVRFKTSLLVCPRCDNALLAGQSQGMGDDDWDDPTRLWPEPDRAFSWHIPVVVRSSLEEANKCFKAAAYSACAVMCGRSLEGICRHFKTKSNYLGGGLKELLEQGTIDKRLFSWSEALRRSRNLGAHATGEAVSKADARDLAEFANAICEYVFVLSDRFKQFMQRQEKENKKESKR